MNMKTYKQTFEEAESKNEGIFIPFLVVGDPDYETSIEIAKTMVDNGADALEIGFPFSDPVADGKTVQNADIRSFKSGTTIEKCFKFLEELREYTDKPFGLLLYYNIIYKYGIDAFYERLSKLGVNAVLVADLPPEESEYVRKASKEYGVEEIFIAAPSTTTERLKLIADYASGFIYTVSVMGITGARDKVEHNTTDMIKRMRKHTDMPLCVGFGISKPEHVKEVINSGANGAIVGSAIINIIADNLDNKEKMLNDIKEYVSSMKLATKKDDVK
ncbi:tryptophan synthase subunit alpha [Methanobrevibacter wolinii]|uniref:tryptophan synthase subunit alpha n=1 Tax=Methanobrevibacter wolinii TaxID=190977 RepID=UPI0005B2D7F4|nr:tryptophan synthase subunit alpha [Methanobrevibacter wolinii]